MNVFLLDSFCEAVCNFTVFLSPIPWSSLTALFFGSGLFLIDCIRLPFCAWDFVCLTVLGLYGTYEATSLSRFFGGEWMCDKWFLVLCLSACWGRGGSCSHSQGSGGCRKSWQETCSGCPVSATHLRLCWRRFATFVLSGWSTTWWGILL